VHITAYCPSCHSRYQLDPSLRGQRMRCPNPVCREIFEVQEVAPEGPPSTASCEAVELQPHAEPSADMRPQQHLEGSTTGTVRTSGSVGDLVPILDAEVVHEVPPPAPPPDSSSPTAEVHDDVPLLSDQEEDLKPIPVDDSLLPPPIHVENLVPLEPDEQARLKPIQEVTSWHVPPPVRNPHAAPTEAARTPESPPPKPKRTLPAVPAKRPEETRPFWHSPPPVRRGGSEPLPEPNLSGGAQPIDPSGTATYSPEPAYDPWIAPSRASRRALWIIGAMVVVAGFLIASVTIMALNAYVRTEANLYALAKREYDKGKYATAANTYQNLVKDFPTSEYNSSYQLLAELSQVRDQVHSAQTDPSQALTALNRFLQAHKGDALLKTYKSDIGQTLSKLAEQLTALAGQQHDPALLASAKEALAQSERYTGPEHVDNTVVLEKIARVEGEIAGWRKKQELLALFGQWQLERPSVKTVAEARHRAKRLGLDQDSEVKERITQMETAARRFVRYVAGETGTTKSASETVEPSLLIVAPMIGPAAPPAESKRAILALARGVLYALDQNTGQELWATRVGIDTATLPVRLPARPASPELLLVLSADHNTIMALEPLTGSLSWQRRLSAPCLGRPLVVGQRAFVPTYDGRVYDIETIQGHVLGHFELGQHLSVGGAWLPGTDLLYFLGDSDYLYVLDAALGNRPNSAQTKECVALLHTGHPSGSLRSEPILVNRLDPFAKAGGTSTIASYLILAQSDGLDHMKLRVFELPIDSPDAPPILQTEPPTPGWSWFQPYYDSERLALVTDAGIFDLFGINQVRNEDKPLFSELREGQKEESAQGGSRLSRGQVVHVADNDFWILANGKLQRRHLDLFGGRTVPVWSSALPLGSPVQGSQVDDSGKTLFVVTQDLTRQIYLATAVAAEDGKIKWQRQLGLESQGDPLVLGHDVITVDRGGGLCVFDGSKYRHQEGREWRRADPIFAATLPGGPITAHLLPGPDGISVYEVSCPATGGKLTLRRYQPAQAAEKPVVPETWFELKTALAGTPAIVGQSLIVPLADGTLRRFPLPPAESRSEGGPNWRAERADVDARCHLVALGADEFLATDGSRGVTHWRWPQHTQTFKMVPEDEAPALLPARIVAAPVLLPSIELGIPWHLCVADSDGNLSLLQGPTLRPERTWPLGGKITAGPFRRGPYVGCIVERNRLFWIDPAKADPLWEYRTRGQGIVGQPQLVGDVLVVADLSGRFIALEPATGKARGPGYGLKASASPAATPVAFGSDAAFVPLTDGTVFLLSLGHLRDPLAASFTIGP
jgi:outer membrane protein assembly factor BamB